MNNQTTTTMTKRFYRYQQYRKIIKRVVTIISEQQIIEAQNAFNPNPPPDRGIYIIAAAIYNRMPLKKRIKVGKKITGTALRLVQQVQPAFL